jgi:hypothetical protein
MSIWKKIRYHFSVLSGHTSPADMDEVDWSLFDHPNTTSDPGAWDKYWQNEIENGVQFGLGPRLEDMFVDDTMVVSMMRQLGFDTVLCAGNGISQEPRALASTGLDVTAMDLSPVALQIAQDWDFDEDHAQMLLDPSMRAPGGSLRYVAGDLLDTDICPGPFDLVIERRTAQLFGTKMGEALAALSKRLARPGVFLSHCHDGSWKPPQPRVVVTEKWFRSQGWAVVNNDAIEIEVTDRIAWPFLSTG